MFQGFINENILKAVFKSLKYTLKLPVSSIFTLFEEFSKGLLYRLSAKKFEITEFGTIEFEDYYI